MKSPVVALLTVASFGLLGYITLLSGDSDEYALLADTLNRRAQFESNETKTVDPRGSANIAIDYGTDVDDHLPFEMCPLNKDRDKLLNGKWKNYRLSDVLKGQFKDSVEEMRSKYAFDYGSDTIVDDYLSHIDQHGLTHLTPEILYEVLKPRLFEARDDVAVLHLRMGDTTCPSCWTTPRTGVKWLGQIYSYNKAYYEHILKELKERAPEVTSIVIAAATIHASYLSDASYSNAAEEVKQVRELLEAHGYRVTERINCGTPDEDFIFMASHKHFVEGGGGYSHVVASVVKMNGGQVFFEAQFICQEAGMGPSRPCIK